MKIAAFIDRLDDWINPIVIKELRQAVKSRMVVVLLLGFLGVQLFVVGTTLLMREARSTSGDADWTGGRVVFHCLQVMLLITLMLLVPAYACIRLAGERTEQNVDLLFISTLRPHSIIAGKFFAALMLAMLIFSACAPFMTFTYLLRGIDIPTILLVLGIDLLAMLFGIMSALFLASVPGGRPVKFFFAFAGFIGLTILCFSLVGMTWKMIERGVRGIENNEFWIICSIFTGGAIGYVGLLFFYAVCMISPISSNRVLPIRICLAVVWLLTGVAVWIAKSYVPMHNWTGLLTVWMVLFTQLLSLQFLISTCEREQMGPRLARQVPQRWWLRWPAFFLYTGSANGIAYTVILVWLTLGITCWWLLGNASAPMWSSVNSAFRVHLIVFGYTYCYCLSAVLVRVYLLSSQIRTGYTWLIGMLLVGLGSSIPAVLAYVLFPDQMRLGNEGTWWKLSSPFLAIGEILNDWRSINKEFEEICLWFLAIWAVLVTILALPWYLRQVAAFVPRFPTARIVVEAAKEAATAAEMVADTKPPSDAVIADAPATFVQPG